MLFSPQIIVGRPAKVVAAASSYQGPEDIIGAAALGFWGLYGRAAGFTGNAVDIQRASDSTTNTFAIQSNGFIDASALATFLTSTTGIVTKLYDQVGTKHLDTPTSNNPTIELSVLGSFPAIKTTSSPNQNLKGTVSYAQAQPYTICAVARRYSGTGTGNMVADTGQNGLVFNSGAGNIALYAGSSVVNISTTATENNWHSVQGYFNGLSSKGAVDGTTSSTVNPGAGDFRTPSIGGVGAAINEYLMGYGIWTGDKSSSFAAMSTNDHSLFGF